MIEVFGIAAPYGRLSTSGRLSFAGLRTVIRHGALSLADDSVPLLWRHRSDLEVGSVQTAQHVADGFHVGAFVHDERVAHHCMVRGSQLSVRLEVDEGDYEVEERDREQIVVIHRGVVPEVSLVSVGAYGAAARLVSWWPLGRTVMA